MRKGKELIFDLGKEGRVGFSLPEDEFSDMNIEDEIPADYLRKEEPALPEVSELEAVRHFTELSTRNHGVDSGFYPLGSCTMKYNAKVNEDVVRYSGFNNTHPLQSEGMVQGNLELIYEMDQKLSEITGMDRFTMQPAAGAHGELTGLMIIKSYLKKQGATEKTEVIVPDSAHGTNPASASMVGFKVVEVKSNKKGLVDIDALKEVVSEKTAGLMLTNPNTLGLFEEDITEMAEIVHDVGGLLYYDGANATAIMGKSRPGDMGFDVIHLNLHKTFGTPHGGGGPGSGPVGVKEELVEFLPKPLVEKEEDKYYFNYDMPNSIGKVRSYYGNFGVVVKAYAYLLALGAKGVERVSEDAVLNANYLKEKLKEYYELPYDRVCKHEFVLSGKRQKEGKVATLDIAKRLLDFEVHPPTIYFPLIVEEALMVEPTETETVETLNQFIDTMIQIAKEAEENPEVVQEAPHNTVVSRLDEATAARKPKLRWKSEE